MIHDPSLFTRTLARLYAEQGHPRKAAQIYRHLAEQWPDRPEYIEALEQIEARLRADGPQADQRLIGLIATWVDLEVSHARLKQFKALRSNRRAHRENPDNHVEIDIA